MTSGLLAVAGGTILGFEEEDGHVYGTLLVEDESEGVPFTCARDLWPAGLEEGAPVVMIGRPLPIDGEDGLFIAIEAEHILRGYASDYLPAGYAMPPVSAAMN